MSTGADRFMDAIDEDKYEAHLLMNYYTPEMQARAEARYLAEEHEYYCKHGNLDGCFRCDAEDREAEAEKYEYERGFFHDEPYEHFFDEVSRFDFEEADAQAELEEEECLSVYRAPQSSGNKLPTGWMAFITQGPWYTDNTRRYWSRRDKTHGKQVLPKKISKMRNASRKAKALAKEAYLQAVLVYTDPFEAFYGYDDYGPYDNVGTSYEEDRWPVLYFENEGYQDYYEPDYCEIPNADDRKIWRRQDEYYYEALRRTQGRSRSRR